MLLSQVAINFHGERSAVAVPQPAGDRWNIHASLDTAGGEQVAQVVVGDSLRVPEALAEKPKADFPRSRRESLNVIRQPKAHLISHNVSFGKL